ncbi:MAG TPA: ATP-binding protein [Streptosporangiaceae bacterium]|nr:ATP-binding protein [Streptosporangiaceae bacterium]
MRVRAPVMVGRDNEVRTLTEALAAARTGRGSSIFAVGESGIGKSRLASVVTEAGLAASMVILRGRASSVGPIAPFRPLTVVAEAVLRLCGLVSRDRGGLFVLEDLHDADAETLAVVEYLTDNLAGQPVVLLGTIRTDPSPALDLIRSAEQRGSATLVELRRHGRGKHRVRRRAARRFRGRGVAA